jgi:hypothetical protein
MEKDSSVAIMKIRSFTKEILDLSQKKLSANEAK